MNCSGFRSLLTQQAGTTIPKISSLEDSGLRLAKKDVCDLEGRSEATIIILCCRMCRACIGYRYCCSLCTRSLPNGLPCWPGLAARPSAPPSPMVSLPEPSPSCGAQYMNSSVAKSISNFCRSLVSFRGRQ